ncbi:MAG: LLM class flavin-dependent oxidoreductase, partial [Mycobacterium sp.]
MAAPPPGSPERAIEIEKLGYGAVWVAGSPPAELSFAEPLLEATTSLEVATGVVNIWTADAKPVAESFHRINTAYPGRFVLGIGVVSLSFCGMVSAMLSRSVRIRGKHFLGSGSAVIEGHDFA